MQPKIVDCSELSEDKKTKLEKLIQEDIGFSGLEDVDRVFVVEKGFEDLEMYQGEKEGVSFFHTIDGTSLHIRVQKF